MKKTIEIDWDYETIFQNDTVKITCKRSNDLCRILAKLAEIELYGTTINEKTEVDHWLTFSIAQLSSKNEFANAIQHLDKILAPITYLVGKQLTIADFAVFATLFCKCH